MNYLTPLIDRVTLFDNPIISGAQISPDGQYISILKPLKGVRNIWVVPRGADFDQAIAITEEQGRPIMSYFWSRDSKYILYVQDNGGDENYHLYAVEVDINDKDKCKVRDLSPFDNIRAIILRRSKKDPNLLIVAINDRDPAWHDVYHIDIPSGQRKLIQENNHQLSDFHFDEDDKLRLVDRSLSDGSTEILKWVHGELVRCYRTTTEESASIIRFKDANQAYLLSNKGDRNLISLSLFDLTTDEEKILESDPENEADLSNISFSEQKNTLVATLYTGARTRIYWKDEDYENDYNFLCAELNTNEVSFISGTTDEQQWIVYKDADIDPGAAYYFNRKSRELRFLYRPRPTLPIEHLCEMQAISYISTDELSIPAYLTLPKIESNDLLPAIILVHGGPWARDNWGYNSWVQFLANRGYAVLQPNFRGSTGFGKHFLNAGNLEWGRKMQDDISNAAQYLINNKIADTKRIAIMGGSYGGYATLAGLTFTPDIFACGVCIVGPSNLFTLLESIPPYWESAREMFHNKMGNPNTAEGKALLRERSPYFHADKIKSPLLVAQGNNDPRVKTAESEQIVRAMRDHSLVVEYLNFPDEGHGFANPNNNMAFLAVAEDFLQKHLKGRYQKELTDPLKSIISVVKKDVSTV